MSNTHTQITELDDMPIRTENLNHNRRSSIFIVYPQSDTSLFNNRIDLRSNDVERNQNIITSNRKQIAIIVALSLLTAISMTILGIVIYIIF